MSDDGVIDGPWVDRRRRDRFRVRRARYTRGGRTQLIAFDGDDEPFVMADHIEGTDIDASMYYLECYLQVNHPDEDIVQLDGGPLPVYRPARWRWVRAAAVATFLVGGVLATAKTLPADRGTASLRAVANGELVVAFRASDPPQATPIAKGLVVYPGDVRHSWHAGGIGRPVAAPLVRSGDQWVTGVSLPDSTVYAAFTVEVDGRSPSPRLLEFIPDSTSLYTQLARVAVILRVDRDYPELSNQADELTAHLYESHPYISEGSEPPGCVRDDHFWSE